MTRVKIKDIREGNIKAKEVYDVMKKHNIPQNLEKKKNTDQQYYDDYYDKKEKEKLEKTEKGFEFDEEKVLQAFKDFDAQVRTKQTIEDYKNKQKYNALKATGSAASEVTRNTLYGMGKAISGSGAGLLGILTNLGKYGINKIKDPKNTKFLETLGEENLWLKEQKDFDNMLADILEVKDAYDTDDKDDKRLQFAGEFLVPQTWGRKLFQKSANLMTKNPKKAMDSLKYLFPGLQITKDAPLSKKLIEIGTQTPVALGFDELMSAITGHQGVIGDYTQKTEEQPKQQVTLINNKRKIGKKEYLDQLKDNDYSTIEIPNQLRLDNGWKNYSPFHDELGNINTLGKASIGLGSILGSSYVIRKIKKHNINKKAELLEKALDTNDSSILNGLFDDVNRKDNNLSDLERLSKKLNNKPNHIRKMMTTSQKIDNSLADRMNFIDIMRENGNIDENALYDLSKDLTTQIDSIWNTGQITDTIKVKTAPSIIQNKINTLKLTDPVEYATLEKLIENASIIQDETNRYNRYVLKGIGKDLPDLSPDDYVKGRITGEIPVETSINFRSSKNISELHNNQIELLKHINSNPVLKDIVDSIDDFSNKMLDFLVEKHIYTPEYAKILRKNRNYLGITTYKPRKEKIALTFIEKMKNALYHNIENKFRTNSFDYGRTINSVGEGINFLDNFEHNTKSVFLDAINNERTKNFIKQVAPKQFEKTNEVLDNLNLGNDKFLKKLSKVRGLDDELKSKIIKFNEEDKINKTLKAITDINTVKFLGVEDLDTQKVLQPRNYYKLLNRSEDLDNKWLVKSLNEMFGENVDNTNRAIRHIDTSDDIISFIHNGKKYYFQVDPIIKKGFDSSPELPGLIGRAFKKFKDFRQSTITGKLNPAFSGVSSIYTMQEHLTALKAIGEELGKMNLLDPKTLTKASYMKELYNSGMEILAQNQTKNMIDITSKEIIKNFGDDMQKLGILNAELNNLQTKYNNFLLTEVQSKGAISSKPFNTNSGIYYTLNNDTVLTDKVKQAIINNKGLEVGNRLINNIDFIQNAIREAPNYATIKLLLKKANILDGTKITDEEKLNKILNVATKRLATMGKKGSHLGSVGAVGKFIEDYGLYGRVLFQSLAPKLRNLGVGNLMSNVGKDISMLYDPKYKYIEVLDAMRKQILSAKDNTYLKSYITAGMIPAIMTYAWNHSNQENKDAYYGISDYDKGSKVIFANALGNGKHIMIPIEQELAIVNQLSYMFLDTIFGASKNNLYDPNFDMSGPLVEALNRSLFIDEFTGLDVIGALSGKKINVNPLDNRFGIDDLRSDIVNEDLTKTAKENGILNNYAINGIDALFGTVGRILTGAIEEGNTGYHGETTSALGDATNSVLDNLFKSTKLFSNKFTSYNNTSKYVYDKINLLNDISKTQNSMTPQEKQIYEFIKAYKRNRIDPLHQKLNEFKRTKQKINANSILNGENLSNSYYDRKLKMEDIDKGIANLFRLEYDEYEALNKYLAEQYNTTLEKFKKE